jgi:precorrin-3B synthase
MRHLLAECPVATFLEQAAAQLPINPVVGWQRRVAQTLHIGAHPQAQASLVYVGAVPPLGRLTRICCEARRNWRSVRRFEPAFHPLAKSVAAQYP